MLQKQFDRLFEHSSQVKPRKVHIARCLRVTVVFNSLEVATRSCGESRLNAAVHFTPPVDAGYEIAKCIGEAAYKYMTDISEGRLSVN